jgi:hypothetical protein
MVLSFDTAGGAAMSRYLVTMRPPGRGLNFLGPRVDLGDETVRGFSGLMWNLLEPRPQGAAQ